MKSPIWARWSLLAALDAYLLARLVPDWARLGSGLRAPHRWIESSGADAAGLALGLALLWVAAAWLALGLLLTLLAAAPGPLGARAGAWASQLMPAILVRAVAGAAGLSIIITPATADAQPAAGIATSSRSVEARPPGLPAPAPAPAPAESTPRWPTDPPAGTPSAQPSAAPGMATEVTVVPGDSLWMIAAQRLGDSPAPATVATEWPRWYAANRQQIGPDPALLGPGQVLHAPAVDGPPPATDQRTGDSE